MSTVHGTVQPGFDAVRDGFAAGQRDDEGAAQLAVYQDGRLVVDLWTEGTTDAGQSCNGDSIGIVMSVTKGITATCVHLLAERGLLDIDAPLATNWPEFAACGKGQVSLADVLTHSAGLSGFDPRAGIGAAQLLDWEACVAALAAATPFWEPGTACMYHSITFGYLAGEAIRRATGRTVGQLLANEIAAPLGLDLWIGLPEREEHRFVPQFTRAPQLSVEQALALAASFGIDPDDPLVRSTFAAFADAGAAIEVLNQRQGHAAEIPAANAIGNARSLARLYGAVIGEVAGIRLLSRQAVDRAAAPRTDHLPPPVPFDKLPDRNRSRFGLGYELPRPGLPMLGDGSFGHAGAGGRLGFGQPRTGTAVSYLCTNMSWNPSAGADPRWLPWTSALAAAVGADLTD